MQYERFKKKKGQVVLMQRTSLIKLRIRVQAVSEQLVKLVWSMRIYCLNAIMQV